MKGTTVTDPFEKEQTQFEQEKKEAFTKVKKYGLCKACKDRVNCVKSCEPQIAEFRAKFLECTDEFGNTEMYKLTFTQEDKIELYENLDSDEMEFQYPAWHIYHQNLSHSRYRHNKSENVFKETGNRTPTPGGFSIEEAENYYEMRSRQKGVCAECLVQPSCSKICDAKIKEVSIENKNHRLRTARDNGICRLCKIRDMCHDENCIDREEEEKKIFHLSQI